MNEQVENIQKKQVEWYRMHGRFPQRIAKDKDGNEFVIGDWSWNKRSENNNKCPHCGLSLSQSFEQIEEVMKQALEK